jgi:tRNA(fMet)-specific endonuclease VapC
MAVKWLLDTNACIAIIRRRHERALKRLRGKQVGQVGVSSITLAELEFGAAKSQHPTQARAALAEFLLPLEIAAFDDAAAATYGNVRAVLEKKGRPIGPLDTLIAAHCLALGSVLVTNNTREFRRVPGLTVEDWTA